ncbi:MAG: hypothetical protein KAT37_01360 [Candidatus Aenigmarchaeota archaeon]|nr:hypothetical protein [Candidatus Aenigmarchaeota archaeon]
MLGNLTGKGRKNKVILVKMKIKDAIERAKKKDEVREILKKGGFFCSGFITLKSNEKIEKWNISFYNPETDNITSVLVSENFVETGITDKPLHKRVYNPDESKIKVDSQKALEKARKEFKSYGKPFTKILISFQKKEKEFWNISFITKVGSIVNVRIDSQTGKTIKKEEINLFQKYRAA